MKSYTDFEQSKKLAEILPIESADQTWARIAIAGANLGIPEDLQYKHNGDIPFEAYSGIGIPCWSLAALLNVMPKRFLLIRDSVNEKYHLYTKEYIDTGNHVSSENIVDAVFEMIVYLKERKLI